MSDEVADQTVVVNGDEMSGESAAANATRLLPSMNGW